MLRFVYAEGRVVPQIALALIAFDLQNCCELCWCEPFDWVREAFWRSTSQLYTHTHRECWTYSTNEFTCLLDISPLCVCVLQPSFWCFVILVLTSVSPPGPSGKLWCQQQRCGSHAPIWCDQREQVRKINKEIYPITERARNLILTVTGF